MKNRVRCVLLAISTTLCIELAFAQAPATVYNLEIPRQPIRATLNEFSKQTGLQILLPGNPKIEDLMVGPLSGRFNVESALKELLSGSGLTYRRVNELTIAVIATIARESPGPKRNGISGNNTTHVPALMRLANRPGFSNVSMQGEGRLGVRSRLAGAAGQRGRSGFRSATSPVEEVIVTGTHIRGAAPVGSQLIVIDRKQIDRTGYTTVHDLVDALPQNYRGGGANEATTTGGGPSTNASFASAPNLRGLGPGATLVLLNGRRLAPAGGDASFIDLSAVPLSAVERIDVLTDGASATYGSDAIGGVMNVILRDEYEAAETSMQVTVPTEGGGRGQQVAQTLGFGWGEGQALFSYEFYHREALAARDRKSTRSSDLRQFGGDDFRSRYSNPGNISLGGLDTWAIPGGQNGQNLTAADLIPGVQNLEDINNTLEILPEQTRHSALLVLSQQFGDRVELYANILHSQREAELVGAGAISTMFVPPENPFYVHPTGTAEPVLVNYNFADDLGAGITEVEVKTSHAALGADFTLTRGWDLSIGGAYSREDVDQLSKNRVRADALATALSDADRSTAFNPFGDGSSTNPATLDSIRGSLSFDTESIMSTSDIRASGPIFAVPAGNVSLAVGGEYRQQDFQTLQQTVVSGPTFLEAKTDRNVVAAFGELHVPLFGRANSRAGLRLLNLSIAARYEDYNDYGSSTTPKVGLEWAPADGVKLHGSWGKSFKAPSLPDLSESSNLLFLSATQNASGGFSPVLFWFGGNRDLTEERATAWSAGIDFSSLPIAALNLGMTYFDIDYQDRIQTPPFGSFLLDASLSSFVIQAPSALQRADICGRGSYLGGSVADCVNAPVDAIIDLRRQNTALTHQRGLDFMSSYSMELPRGQLDFAVNATYFLKMEQAQVAATPSLSVLNSPLYPTDFRLRSMVTWAHDGLSATAFWNYTDNYRDDAGATRRSIDSWSTIDFQVRLETNGAARRWLDGTSVALNLQNAFDESAPFYNNPAGVGYDPTNADVVGRTVSLQVRKTW